MGEYHHDRLPSVFIYYRLMKNVITNIIVLFITSKYFGDKFQNNNYYF